MTIIKASCPCCGELELTPADVGLFVCGNCPELSCYVFECSNCHDSVRKPADDHVISLLLSGGVPAHVWDAHEGPRFTWDDLLEFHESLESELEELTS